MKGVDRCCTENTPPGERNGDKLANQTPVKPKQRAVEMEASRPRTLVDKDAVHSMGQNFTTLIDLPKGKQWAIATKRCVIALWWNMFFLETFYAWENCRSTAKQHGQ